MSDMRKPTGELNHKSTYILGVDVARQGADETALVILEQMPFDDNIFIIFVETLNTPDLNQVISRVRFLNERFNFKKIIIDETGMGAALTDVLKDKIGAKIEGVWYTAKSKAELFNNLKILMTKNNGRLYIPDYKASDNPIVKKMFYQFLSITQEFKDGTTTPKISHEEREHDDIVNALALAASYFKVKSKKRFPLAGVMGRF